MQSCVGRGNRITYGFFGLVVAAAIAAVGWNGLSVYARNTRPNTAWYAASPQTETGPASPADKAGLDGAAIGQGDVPRIPRGSRTGPAGGGDDHQQAEDDQGQGRQAGR